MIKNIFLKTWAILTLGLTITVFYSCENDDSSPKNENDDNVSTIKATNVINSSNRITTVIVPIPYYSDYSYYDVIAQAPYKNKGFELKLPTTLSSKYLYPIERDHWDGDITISDENAKIWYLEEFVALDEDENYIGHLYLGDEEYDIVEWVYVDRNVTLKGVLENEYDYIKYDLEFKKGWNLAYWKYTGIFNGNGEAGTYTSKKPSGANYQWYFDSYDYDYRSTKTKSIIKQKHFLQH
ncbi:MAG: hypothetical protein LBL58_10030 [Tannerellaceae bacterium]|jgi:hypothetical protein|nr:hypothetical protein [Tannerellaceae bacterium]